MAEGSSPCAFQWSIARRMSSRSLRPTISSNLRKPICAMYSRTSWATKVKKLTTCSALPWNFSRSLGFWVAMPTGQVSRWQTRIMTQPMTTSGRGRGGGPGAGAAGVTADEGGVRLRLGDAGGGGADPALRHELDVDAGARV